MSDDYKFLVFEHRKTTEIWKEENKKKTSEREYIGYSVLVTLNDSAVCICVYK